MTASSYIPHERTLDILSYPSLFDSTIISLYLYLILPYRFLSLSLFSFSSLSSFYTAPLASTLQELSSKGSREFMGL